MLLFGCKIQDKEVKALPKTLCSNCEESEAIVELIELWKLSQRAFLFESMSESGLEAVTKKNATYLWTEWYANNGGQPA